MKQTLKLLTALFLAPLATLHAATSSDSRIVIASEAGAKLDSNVSKGGGTDNTALIQSILDRAPKLGSLKLVVDGAILVRGLKVHSNTTIECLEHVLDHQAGTIEALDLRDLSIPATTKAVHHGSEAKVSKTKGASVK